MKSGKYDYLVRFLSPTVPWVFVKKIKAATMRYGCILQLPTLAETAQRNKHDQRLHLKGRYSPYQLNKEGNGAHGEQSDQSHSAKHHPYEQYVLSHDHNSKRLTQWYTEALVQ